MRWYRELIPDYATIALPITRLRRKNVKFEWNEECQQALNTFKVKLSTYTILKPPNSNIPFHVFCNASAVVVGSALCQLSGEKDKDQPVACASR